MSEQDATAPVEDEAPVTENAAPSEAEAPAAPPEGFIEQDRYENLRREFNQRQSLWNRAQQGDLDAMRELNLPLQFEDDDAEQEDDEEPGLRDPRLDTLLQEREQERLQKEQEEGWNRFNSDLDQLAKDKSLDDDDRLMIYTKTLQAGGSPDALRDAFSDYAKKREAHDKAVIQSYLESKRNAPFVSPGGTGATEVPNLDDGPTRRQWLAEKLAAAEALD